MDVVTYALVKKIAKSAVSGIQSYSIEGQTLTMVTNEGQVLQMVFPTPQDGVSVTGVTVDSNNHMKVTLSDGTVIDSGQMPSTKVELSSEKGNALEVKDDGLYVSASGTQVSKKENNGITTEEDGLYVGEVTNTDIDSLFITN